MGVDLSKYKRREGYDCDYFAADYWCDLTGEVIHGRMSLWAFRQRKFIELDGPASPCIVSCVDCSGDRHIGVYHQGNMVHLGNLFPEVLPIRIITQFYHRVRYYQPC